VGRFAPRTAGYRGDMTNLSQPGPRERLNRADRRHETEPHGTETTAGVDEVAHGKSPATPFMLLGSVAVAVWSAATVVAVAALLIWWLV
jgi:hypothetical protein